MDYTNRELDLIFKEIRDRMDEHIDTDKEILEQVKKTNGRVKNLELWRAGLAGGFAVISLIVLPYILYLLTN